MLEIGNRLEPPFFFLLKSLFHGLEHEVLEWWLGTGLQPNFIIHRDPDLAVLDQLDVLHRVDGAVVGPHVEAVPLVDLVLVLFGDLLHHLADILCFAEKL